MFQRTQPRLVRSAGRHHRVACAGATHHVLCPFIARCTQTSRASDRAASRGRTMAQHRRRFDVHAFARRIGVGLKAVNAFVDALTCCGEATPSGVSRRTWQVKGVVRETAQDERTCKQNVHVILRKMLHSNTTTRIPFNLPQQQMATPRRTHAQSI